MADQDVEFDKHFGRVLRLLDSEVERLRSEEARSGLTVWVLAAAAGAIGYLALEVWSSDDLHIPSVAHWMVGLSIPTYMVLNALAASTTHDISLPGRVRPARESLQQQRLPAFILAGIAGGLATLAWSYRFGISSTAAVVTVVVLALGAIGNALAAFMSFTDVRIPQTDVPDNPLRTGLIVWGLAVGLSAYMSSAYLRSVTPLVPGSGWSELRFSILSITTATLVVLLSKKLDAPPQLTELSKLRRELLLGVLDPDDASHAAEMSLLGSDVLGELRRLADIAEGRLHKFVEQVGAATATIEQAETKLSELGVLSHRDLERLSDNYVEQREEAVKHGERITGALASAATLIGSIPSAEEIEKLPSRVRRLLYRLQNAGATSEDLAGALQQAEQRFIKLTSSN